MQFHTAKLLVFLWRKWQFILYHHLRSKWHLLSFMVWLASGASLPNIKRDAFQIKAVVCVSQMCVCVCLRVGMQASIDI